MSVLPTFQKFRENKFFIGTVNISKVSEILVIPQKGNWQFCATQILREISFVGKLVTL